MKKYLLLSFTFTVLLGTFNLFSQNSCCDYNDTGNYPGTYSETFGVALGDIDSDGDVDAVIVDAYDDMEVYLNDGTATFTFDQSYGTVKEWFGVSLVDVDLDGDLDIILAAFYSGSGCEVWLNNGLGNFTFSQGLIATSIAMRKLGIGDLNGDGYPDIFAPAYSGSGSEVWLNDGTGAFTNTNQILSGSSCTQATLADLDGDGDLDAYVSSTNGTANKVWINTGAGSFYDSGQSLGDAFSSGAAAADIDNDGDMDVVVSNWQVPSQIWLNDGNASFTAGAQINNNNYAKAVVISDIDYDCDDDIILGSYGSNGVQVWTNDGQGTFSLCFENSTSNDVYAHDIAVADLNNDSMPDIWAGNFSSSEGDHIFLKTTPIFVYDTLILCPGDSLLVGCEWRTGEGDYLEALNCDTLSWYHISEIAIDTSLSQNGDTLFAIPNYTGYQWYDCETMNPIAGANSYYYLSEVSGSYYVEITNQSCTAASSCHWVQIPTAGFEGTPTTGDVPLLVAFTDLSVDSVSTWQWDFGDGNTSTEQNPDNEYVNPGFYTVALIIVGPGGSDTLTKSNYIHPTYTSPTADFEGVPSSGVAPLEVTFTDLSVDSVNTWVWDFGDGSTSVYQSPVYTYTAAGSYTVSLTVGGPGGSDEMIKTDYIVVNADAPVADFEGNPTFGEAPLLVNFTDLSTGNINTWNWSFGDGDSSLVQHPTHEYLSPGNFTVSLTATGDGGSDTEVKIDYILIPVGISENTKEAIIVYPNPATNKLHIIFADAKKRNITLKNTSGKQIFEKISYGEEDIINLQQYAQGVYSLVIKDDNNNVSVVKVVKK